MTKILGGIALFLLALATGGYFIFRPAETRKQDRKRVFDKAQSIWTSATDYVGKLFQGEGEKSENVSEIHRPSPTRGEALAS